MHGNGKPWLGRRPEQLLTRFSRERGEGQNRNQENTYSGCPDELISLQLAEISGRFTNLPDEPDEDANYLLSA